MPVLPASLRRDRFSGSSDYRRGLISVCRPGRKEQQSESLAAVAHTNGVFFLLPLRGRCQSLTYFQTYFPTKDGKQRENEDPGDCRNLYKSKVLIPLSCRQQASALLLALVHDSHRLDDRHSNSTNHAVSEEPRSGGQGRFQRRPAS